MSQSQERSDEPLYRDDVARLAELAHIDLQSAELEHLAKQIPGILGHVKSVQDAAGPDVEPMSHASAIKNVMRTDTVRPSLSPEEALAMAPQTEQQRFRVPRILGED